MSREQRLDLEIMGLFLRNTYLSLSINQIATRLGKTYPAINRKTNEMIRKKIFKKKIIGRSYLCTPNLDNPHTVVLFTLLELEKRKEVKQAEKKKVKEYLERIRKNSDTICIIFSKKEFLVCIKDSDNIKEQIKEAPGNLRIRAVTLEDLTILLENSDLLENHVVLYGYERFYQLLSDRSDRLRTKHDPLVMRHG